MNRTAAQPDVLLSWMECLADATRLRLMRLLERHELGVVGLCDVLQLPQSTVSRHLRVLSDQCWARSRRQGTTHLYRMILDELEPAARKLWLVAREQTESWPAIRQDGLRLERRLREKEAGSQAFFAGAAGEWDKLRGELYGQVFAQSAMLSLLPADYVVADLGCGTAPVAAQLAPHVQRIIGIDHSPAMLRAGRKRTDEFSNVDLRRGELTALPIDDATCDAALLLLALTYVPEPLSALREMARILKPAGRAVIVDLMPHDREDFRRQFGQQHLGFEADSMRKMLTDAGFVNIGVSTLPPEPRAKGPSLFLAAANRTTRANRGDAE